MSLFRLSVEEPLEEEVSDSDWLIQDPVGEVSEEVFMSLINGVSLFLLSVEETLEEEIFDSRENKAQNNLNSNQVMNKIDTCTLHQTSNCSGLTVIN